MADSRRQAKPEVRVPGPACFTAEPSGQRARTVHISYKNMMRTQFLAALESAADGLKIDLSHLSRRFQRLDPRARLSPAIYVALSNLTEALRSGDITRVLDSLQDVRVTPDERFLDARFRIESVLTESWEKAFIEEVRSERIEGVEDGARILRPILDEDLVARLAGLSEALELLTEVDPDLSTEFLEYVSRVKLFVGRGYLGVSSPAAFGAIFIRVPDANPTPYFLEHLVHELSHLSLNAIMAHDPLHQNPTDENSAPLRPDSRPLYQILHATFVLSRNVRVSRRVVERHPELGYQRGLETFEAAYAEGYRTIEEQAELTEMGNRLFASLEPVTR